MTLLGAAGAANVVWQIRDTTPSVEAELQNPNGDGLTLPVDGKSVDLPDGTELAVECMEMDPNQPGTTFRAYVRTGQHAGDLAVNVPREALVATSDPYHTNGVGQDPFAPLPDC